jgi:hypothetical protein
MSEEDDLFDNGIDGEPWDYDGANDDLYEIAQEGGIIIHNDPVDKTMVVYYSGQWNDSGVDPDTIVLTTDGLWKDKAAYFLAIEVGEARIKTPTKSFKLDISFRLDDFVKVNSTIPIVVNKTNIGDLVDSISAKTTTIVFDKEKFKDKLERFSRLLVFS